jgi:hypothetical protein
MLLTWVKAIRIGWWERRLYVWSFLLIAHTLLVDLGAWRWAADEIDVEFDVAADLTLDDGGSGPRWEAVQRAVTYAHIQQGGENTSSRSYSLFPNIISGCDVLEAKGICLSPTLPKTRLPVRHVAVVMPIQPQ